MGKGAPLQDLRASQNLARRAHAGAVLTADRVGKISLNSGAIPTLGMRDFAHPSPHACYTILCTAELNRATLPIDQWVSKGERK